MQRYFFDAHNGFDYPDADGVELADIECARKEALKIATELSQIEGREHGEYSISVKVRDEDNANVLTIRMICQVDDCSNRHLKIAS